MGKPDSGSRLILSALDFPEQFELIVRTITQ